MSVKLVYDSEWPTSKVYALDVLMDNGERHWYHNGVLHRVGAPSVLSVTRREWWLNGERHNLDGPAIVNSDGTHQWFVEGVEVSEYEMELLRDFFQKH